MFGRYTTGPTRLRAGLIIPEPSSFVNHGFISEYNAKLLVTLRLPRLFKAMTMQFTECR
jgi:hypothetical protein